MKRVLPLAGLAGSVLLSTLALATETTYSSRGTHAVANAYGQSECGYINVNLAGFRGRTQMGTPEPERQDTVSVWFEYQNFCDGWTYTFSGVIDDGYDGNLESAMLDVSFQAERYRIEYTEQGPEYIYGEPVAVEITAELLGVGEIDESSYLLVERSPGYYHRTRIKGKVRAATVDLALTVDGLDVEPPGVDGNLQKGSGVEIYQIDD